MKISELLQETLDNSANLDMAHKWLNKNGWWSEHNSTHLTLKNVYLVVDLYVNDDVWNIDWFHNGKIYRRSKGLTFEKAMKALKLVKTTALIGANEALAPVPQGHRS